MNTSENIEAKIEKLPDYIKPELNDFVEFLLSKYGEKESQNYSEFKFDWEGEVSNLRPKLTSVELQHKAMDWR